MKSDIEIKDDIYAVLKGSALVAEADGALRKTKRPTNSNAEDIVISVTSNEDMGTKQIAIVYVHIYVPDIVRDKQYEENSIRLRKLAQLANETLEVYNGGDFRFELTGQRTIESEGINSHIIANQIRYEQNNDK